MAFLTDIERATLTQICDTFVPRLMNDEELDDALAKFGADDVHVATQIEETVERIGGDEGQASLRRFLRLMRSRLVNGFMAGMWDRFEELSLDERTKVLQRWSTSWFGSARKSFQAIKRLALSKAYSSKTADGQNPAWSSFEYSSPDSSEKESSGTLSITGVSAATSVDCDVLVIGSGAGGGVVAAELSAAGLDVVVVEKGRYYRDADLRADEHHGMRHLYEREGTMSTSDLGIIVLAGNTLGGGTAVNWMTSLRPPEDVLEDWKNQYGFTAATSDEFQKSVDFVCGRINVNTNECEPNGSNAMLERGCNGLGYDCSIIPRNAKDCTTCDFCSYGCSHGGKQDTRRTFLLDAQQSGTRIIDRAHVERIEISNGQVTGATLKIDNGTLVKEVQVRCKAAVVAAGSIHSPAILRRSGLSNPNIGANLYLHPATGVFGIFDEPMYPWRGAPQTRVCNEFANLDGEGYGVRMETCPAHPGLSALALPWTSGKQHKRLMQSLHRMANVVVLTRDKNPGRVEIDSNGRPVLDYQLHPFDAAHLLHGIVEALRIMHEAGAETIYSPHVVPHRFDRNDSKNNKSLDEYLDQVRRAGIRTNSMSLFSAHQLSTCRIAGDESQGVVSPEGETFEVKNLFVADGSTLPSSCGANPMITIMSTSHYLAQHIKSRLA